MNRYPEDAIVQHARVDLPLGHLRAGHVGPELDAVQMREAALPLGERRAPICAVRNLSVESHGLPRFLLAGENQAVRLCRIAALSILPTVVFISRSTT